MNKDTISEENSGRVSFLRGLSTNPKEENSDMNAASERSLNQIRKMLDEDDEMRKFIRPKEGTRIYSLSRTFFDEM